MYAKYFILVDSFCYAIGNGRKAWERYGQPVKSYEMTKLIQTIILSLAYLTTFGQYDLSSEYKFSADILGDSLNSNVALELSYIGEYQKTLESYDIGERKWPTPTADQVNEFKKYRPVSANEFIREKAKTEQIIILNEAHHQPYHRTFTTSLLQDLYNQGYRYFGAETIWYGDSLLNYRKYPSSNTGFYSQEPCYGNLIREALRIGYKVFSYETTRRKIDSAGINFREIDQAINIKKILEKDSLAKILIHCGFDHIVENTYPAWGKAMAGRLIEYTGINPYTIDQIPFTERSSMEYENPLFRDINLEYYAVFVDSGGHAFNGIPRHQKYDARIYHPRTIIINGRPNWMFEEERKPYFVEKASISFPCLVFAYLAEELEFFKNDVYKPIPFDIIELKSSSDKKALSLKKGRYKIIIRDLNGQIQKFEITM